MKYIAAVSLLWVIAIFATLMIVRDTNAFGYLGPVFFICLVGSIFTVRHAIRSVAH